MSCCDLLVHYEDLASVDFQSIRQLEYARNPWYVLEHFLKMLAPKPAGSSLIDERYLAHFQSGWGKNDVGQRSHDSASFVFEIVIHDSPRISERIGDRLQAIFTYKVCYFWISPTSIVLETLMLDSFPCIFINFDSRP